jgi:hypothetical protein
MTALAIALMATPFLFGLARLVTTGSGWRYLAVAAAATLGAGLVILPRRGGRVASGMRVLVAIASAGVLAALAALAVGARSATAIAMVAIGFAMCSAGGATQLLRARHRSALNSRDG